MRQLTHIVFLAMHICNKHGVHANQCLLACFASVSQIKQSRIFLDFSCYYIRIHTQPFYESLDFATTCMIKNIKVVTASVNAFWLPSVNSCFIGEPYEPFSPQFSSSACSGRDLWILSGTGFFTDQMPFMSRNCQCQSIEGNSKQ